MKILSYSLLVLSVAALFAAGIMTMMMTIQTAEAKEKIYCPTDLQVCFIPSDQIKDTKGFCESYAGKGECEKRK